jgi:putative membrane protein
LRWPAVDFATALANTAVTFAGGGFMHIGRSYRVADFVVWSRRSVIYMAIVSVVAVLAFLYLGFSVPWAVVLVLGTTVSLVAGFKNSQVLGRSSEALAAFSQIQSTSRMLATITGDFLAPDVARQVLYRHIAWLTALRYALRRPMPWETMARGATVNTGGATITSPKI